MIIIIMIIMIIIIIINNNNDKKNKKRFNEKERLRVRMGSWLLLVQSTVKKQKNIRAEKQL